MCHENTYGYYHWFVGRHPMFDDINGKVRDLLLPFEPIDDLFNREPNTVGKEELNLVMLKLFY